MSEGKRDDTMSNSRQTPTELVTQSPDIAGANSVNRTGHPQPIGDFESPYADREGLEIATAVMVEQSWIPTLPEITPAEAEAIRVAVDRDAYISNDPKLRLDRQFAESLVAGCGDIFDPTGMFRRSGQ